MQRVVCVPIKRLRRGDAVLAVRWAGCGKRMAGVNKRSRVLARFVMRKPAGEFLALVLRREDGAVVGYDSEFSPDCVAFVLREVAA